MTEHAYSSDLLDRADVDDRSTETSVFFRERLESALEASDFRSWRQVATASDCSPAMLQGIARGSYDGSPKGPGVFLAHKVASTLNTTLNDLLPTEQRPSVSQFLSLYSGPNTPIETFGATLRFCDVYDKPTGGATHIKRVGPNSLLRERSGLADPATLQLQYDNWPTARRRRIYERQRRAWTSGALSELEFFDVRFEQSRREIRVAFLLAACRVIDFDGAQRLLIFCEPMLHKD